MGIIPKPQVPRSRVVLNRAKSYHPHGKPFAPATFTVPSSAFPTGYLNFSAPRSATQPSKSPRKSFSQNSVKVDQTASNGAVGRRLWPQNFRPFFVLPSSFALIPTYSWGGLCRTETETRWCDPIPASHLLSMSAFRALDPHPLRRTRSHDFPTWNLKPGTLDYPHGKFVRKSVPHHHLGRISR